MNYFHKICVFEQQRVYWLVIVCFICLGLFSLVEQACAQTATSSFLSINVDARGTAMGGAQGASTNDVYAVYWNPAGLSKVLLKEVAFTRQNMFQGLTYNFLGYAMPTRSYGTLAAQLFLLSSGEITRTLENPDGSFGGIGDSFSVSDFGLGFSQSKAVMKNISYGVSLKFLSHRIADERALSIAIDGGLLYQTMMERLRVGVALQNLSSKYRFIDQKLREPWNMKFSALYIFSDRPLFLTTDFNHISGQQDTLNIGVEYWYLDLIAVRAGMKLPPPAGLLSTFSMGFGVNWRDLYQLDYSFSPHGPLGTSQCFSMFIRF